MSNIRQSIIDAMEIRFGELAGIKTVEVWHLGDWAENELPAIDIRDTTDEMPIEGIRGRRDHQLAVELTVKLIRSTSAADAREMIADIIKAIGIDETYGIQNTKTFIADADLVADAANQKIASARVALIVKYRSELWSI